MKRLLLVCIAMAMVAILIPSAFASTLTFAAISPTYTLTSDSPADLGSNVSIVNAYIENTGAYGLTLSGIEFFLGGSQVTGAPGDTPAVFKDQKNGWTYSLGEGEYSSSTGTYWAENGTKKVKPTAGGAADPTDSSTTDYLSAVALDNGGGNLSGPLGTLPECTIEETLAAGAGCYVELVVNPNYGGAIGSSSSTFIYGYAEGESGKAGKTSEAGGMEETITVDPAPEPRSLVLLGAGFALLGSGLFLRRRLVRSRAAMSHPSAA